MAEATEIMRLNKGIDALGKSFEDWADILKNSNSASQEYFEAFDGITAAMADMLNVSQEIISDSFVQEHLDLIGEAAKGSEEAIDSLNDSLLETLMSDWSSQIDSKLYSTIESHFNSIQSILTANPLTIPLDIDEAGQAQLEELGYLFAKAAEEANIAASEVASAL